MDLLPKLRHDLQLLPVMARGQKLLAVKDLLGLTGQTAVLSSAVLGFLPFFDGAHDQALLAAFCAGSAPDFWAESRRVRARCLLF